MKDPSVLQQICNYYDSVAKHKKEFVNGKIDKVMELWRLVPDETRDVGRHRIKHGPGTLLECVDIIKEDSRGRKMQVFLGEGSRCRNTSLMQGSYPLVAKPYFCCSVPMKLCRRCEHYLKKQQTPNPYPVCGFIWNDKDTVTF